MRGTIKKTFPLILSMLMVFSAFVPVFASAASNDYDSHWARATIQAALDSGVVTGYPDGSFQPEGTITRAEFFQMVNKRFGYTNTASVIYSDVPQNAWYYQTVAKANSAGYISGFSDGSIHPGDRITRQEVAVIVNRLRSLITTSTALRFSDAPSAAEWSRAAIIAAVDAKIMVGYPDGRFMPDAQLKRAEALIAVNNCFNYGTTAQTSDVWYLETGSFGPTGEPVTIPGNIVIKAPGVTLKNVIVNGNATIGKEVNDGSATLQNATIKGTLYIESGMYSRVELINVIAENVVVLKDADSISLVVSGTTSIGKVTAASSVKFEESNLTGEGFKVITIADTASSITASTLVNVDCERFNIKPNGTTLTLDKESEIGSLLIDGSDTNVSGTGTIISSVVGGSNVTFESTLIRK